MEQVGEKQDFESALTRHALRHEDFMLRMSRPVEAAQEDPWSHDYIVTVVAIAPGIRRRYVGGPRHDWVDQFAIDVAHGVYGLPPAADTGSSDVATLRSRDGLRTASPFQRGAY